MSDVTARFREFVQLDRRREAEGLTPEELDRWMLLKRFLNKRFSPGLSEERADQRHSVRVPARLTVSFRDTGELRNSLMTNLSRGGLFVATERPLEIGSSLELRIDVAETDDRIDVKVEVVSLNLSADLSRTRRGMGLRFVDPAPEIQRKLDELYEQQLKKAAIELE